MRCSIACSTSRRSTRVKACWAWRDSSRRRHDVSGFIDLHLHYVPGVDDGVKSTAEGIQLCRELKAVGYAQLVTTPHIRAGMFENRKPGLVAAFDAFAAEARAQPDLPALA